MAGNRISQTINQFRKVTNPTKVRRYLNMFGDKERWNHPTTMSVYNLIKQKEKLIYR